VSEDWWNEPADWADPPPDARARRREALFEAQAAARAREEAVADLPSVLRLASRAVDHLARRTLEARGMADVSLTGLDILGLATRPFPVVTLADRLKITPQAVSQTVGQLVRRGLVDKQQGYPDRRTVVVRATEDGLALHRAARTALDDALNVVADDVFDGGLADLTENLARVADVDRRRHPWNR
jgi:MarR family transcriptional regulator, organic hydroperoxide resistance regulator